MKIIPKDQVAIMPEIPLQPITYKDISDAAQPLIDLICRNTDAIALAIVTSTHVDLITGAEIIKIPSTHKED